MEMQRSAEIQNWKCNLMGMSRMCDEFYYFLIFTVSKNKQHLLKIYQNHLNDQSHKQIST